MNSISLFLRQLFYNSNLLYSLRILVSLTGTTFIPWLWGNTLLVIPLTLGVVAAALTEIDDGFLGRLRNLLLIISCFLIASISVELLFPYPLLFLGGLLTSTISFILLGALGQRYAVIAFGSLLIAAYTMLGHDMYHDPFSQPIYLIIGVLWYNLIALIELVLFPIRATQNALANSFHQLSYYLECKAAMFDPDEKNGFKQQNLALTQANQQVMTVLNQTKEILFKRLKSGRNQSQMRRMMNYFFIAQDIHERASSSHVHYQALSQQFKHSDILFRFARILSMQSKACLNLAINIRMNQTYQHDQRFEDYFIYLREAIDQLSSTDKKAALLTNSLVNLNNNLYAINTLLANIHLDTHFAEPVINKRETTNILSNVYTIYENIKQNITFNSALFRHAIRISIVLSVDYLIIQVSEINHGYWIILTSLFVCQPNYSATRHRLKLRILGTIIGILLGLPLTYLLPNIQAQLVLIILSGWLFFLFKNSQYAYATAFITLLVFFSFGLVGESSMHVAIDRIIATLIGCFISWLAVTYLWPDWKYRNISQLVKKMISNDCHYLAKMEQQYQLPNPDQVNYYISRQQAYESVNQLLNELNLMTNEPHVNNQLIEQCFQLLSFNQTLLSFISTLGAHRRSSVSIQVMYLFNSNINYIITHLSSQQPISESTITILKRQLTEKLDKITLEKENKIDLLILQQLILILDMLVDFTQLIAELSKINTLEHH